MVKPFEKNRRTYIEKNMYNIYRILIELTFLPSFSKLYKIIKVGSVQLNISNIGRNIPLTEF